MLYVVIDEHHAALDHTHGGGGGKMKSGRLAR
jgi:hypothetical protein